MSSALAYSFLFHPLSLCQRGMHEQGPADVGTLISTWNFQPPSLQEPDLFVSDLVCGSLLL